MKILHFVLAVMFLFFAFLQVDDPDPLLWITVYGTMAVIAILGMFNVYNRKVIIVLLVLFAGYSMIYLGGVGEWFASEDKSLLFDDLAKMQYPYVEEAREFLGLWICIAALAFFFVRTRRTAK